MLIYGIPALILVILILTWFGGLYFFKTAIRRAPKPFLIDNPNLMPEPDNELISSASDLEWLDMQDGEMVSITSHDGLKLQGIWLASTGKSSQTVILAHGYSGRGREMAGFARYYVEKEAVTYSCLMIELMVTVKETSSDSAGWIGRITSIGSSG